MMSRDQAIVRIVSVTQELRRLKLDHYGDWETDPTYLRLSKEYEELSKFLESFN